MHAAYSWSPFLDTIRMQAIEGTQMARAEGFWTPTDDQELSMMASFYRTYPNLNPPSNADGVHYYYNPTHESYHGDELSEVFARLINNLSFPTPEPSTLAFIGLGMAITNSLLRRRSKQKIDKLDKK